ncbi:phage Gp37/Gp68 family protein [uncultured Brevundimonas sp.]|uniref:phage Gp37/Gp68 family protein n=1 Tax=uncultured Brevundimonas sp. TaxID=213418 RepID=UPI0025D57C2E|nr:phage Gp37/Gp68 family protein [uncultured Brevundimonas sp.]
MSKIEWTERTWNPIVGCAIVSPGCKNCYAMRAAYRMGANPATPHYAGLTRLVNGKAVWTGEMRLHAPSVVLPLRRRVPTIWFVNSMSDLFAEGVQDEWLDRIFAVMAMSPWHTYQVLTKRPERMRAYLTDPTLFGRLGRAMDALRLAKYGRMDAAPQAEATLTERGHRIAYGWGAKTPDFVHPWPLPNVWLGVSTEDQVRADERIPILLDTPAAVRWISAEPLLGAIDLVSDLGGTQWIGGQRGCGGTHTGTGEPGCPRHPHHHHDNRCRRGLDWVVVGGESGADARPMHPAWARTLRAQCQAAGVAFFFKQWGEWAPVDQPADRLKAVTMTLDAVKRAITVTPEGQGDAPAADASSSLMERVGKKTAGRILDGVIHEATP